MENKNTVQAFGLTQRQKNLDRKSQHAISVSLLHESREEGILILRCGDFRCVGGWFACAGVQGRQPLYTAVFCFLEMSITYMAAYINRQNRQIYATIYVAFAV